MARLLRAETVARCLDRLRNMQVHEQFAYYLCLKRTSVIEQRETELTPDYKRFWDRFLRVPGGPARAPYINVFCGSPPSPSNLWFNKNVAGSYALSSIRPTAPILRVAVVDRVQKHISLQPKHPELSKEHLLFGRQVPALELACFLYRNYGLVDDTASATEYVDAFRSEFGYDTDSGELEFSVLFENAPTDTEQWLI